MTACRYFAEAPGKFDGQFNRKHFGFKHNLVGHPLFELDRLADLSKVVMTVGGDQWSPNHNVLYKPAETVPNSAKQWDNFKSAERVHEAIRNIRESRAWVLITGADIDPDYRRLLDEILADGEQACGAEFLNETIWSTFSILVGSPNSVTHYHIDSESNFLFQIHGHKEAHLFDADDRSVIREDEIERFVAVSDEHIKFDPEFEKKATVYDVRAGDGIHIPPYAGHWVRNLSEYSVTATALFYTRTATKRAWVYQCNHLLREFGLKPKPPGKAQTVDGIKAGLIGMLTTRRPMNKYDFLRSGVRRLTSFQKILKLPGLNISR
jgi:Cupin-like domain